MNKRKIAIFGGSGLLGRSICQKFGDEFDLMPMSSRDCNLLFKENASHTIKNLREDGYDTILNLAAVVGGIKMNMGHQDLMYTSNYTMCSNVIEACKENGIERLGTALSTCIFPQHEEKEYPLNEDSFYGGYELPKTNFGYAMAKRAAHELTMLANMGGHNYMTFSPTNLFGPYDNFDPFSSHFVAAVIKKTFDAKEGDVLMFHGEGSIKRQQLFAPDCASMVMQALLDPHVGADALIMTTDSITNEEIIEKVIKISGKDITYSFDGKFPGQLNKEFYSKHQIPGIKMTDIDEALAETYDHYRKTTCE
jgi:GDP-L-fucose synthase